MSRSYIRCTDEFKTANFGLNHPYPKLFVASQWPVHPAVYLAWRIFTAGFFIVWILLSGLWDYDWHTTQSNRSKWFIYLTNWSFTLLTLSCIVRALLAAKYYNGDNRSIPHMYYSTDQSSVTLLSGSVESTEKMTWDLKMDWLLYNIATMAAVLTTFSYAIFFFVTPIHPVDFVAHVINSVYVLLDLFISAIPLRLYHIIHGIGYILVYTVFDLVYVLAGGTNAEDYPYIYYPFDWKSDLPSSLLSTLAMLAVPFLIWPILYEIYRLRCFLCRLTSQKYLY